MRSVAGAIAVSVVVTLWFVGSVGDGERSLSLPSDSAVGSFEAGPPVSSAHEFPAAVGGSGHSAVVPGSETSAASGPELVPATRSGPDDLSISARSAGPRPGGGRAAERERSTQPVGGEVISGVVQDRRAAPVAGALLTLLPIDEESIRRSAGREGSTERHGDYHFDGLEAGRYWLSVSAEGYAERVERVRTGQVCDVQLDGELRLVGVVSDGRGWAVPGARLTAFAVHPGVPGFPRSALTDDLGQFEIGGLGGQPIRLWVVCEGYADWVGRVRPGSEPVAIELEFLHAIAGTVVDETSGVGLASATVACVDRGEVGGRCLTNRLGEFQLELGESGPWTIEVRCDGYASSRFVVGVSEAPRVYPLRPDVTLEVYVMDEQRRPVPSAVVTATRIDSLTVRSVAVTDRRGEAALVGLDPGVYTMRTSRAGMASSVETVRVDPEAAETSIVLRPGAPVEGRVLDAQRRPVSCGAVEITSPHETLRVWPDPDGRFCFPRIAAGDYTVTHLGGGHPDSVSQTIHCDGLGRTRVELVHFGAPISEPGLPPGSSPLR